MRATTGAERVLLGAHSLGTAVAAHYLKFDGGHAAVAHFVSLAPAFKGTTFYGRKASRGTADQ